MVIHISKPENLLNRAATPLSYRQNINERTITKLHTIRNSTHPDVILTLTHIPHIINILRTPDTPNLITQLSNAVTKTAA